MERTTFSVLFYIRRTKLNREGDAPIVMRITVNSVRVNAYVKKWIPPQLWSAAKGKAIEKNAYTKELNLYLDSIRLRIMKIQRDMEIDGEQVTAQKVLDRYLGKDRAQRRTLIEVFQEHNDKCRKLSGIDMAPATVQRYETCLNHTKEFIKHRYGKSDMYLDEIDRQFIENLEFWYKTEKKCAHNTTTKYLKNFKKIIRIALANDLMKTDPFRDIKFRLEEVERDFLEKHELDVIANKKLSIGRMDQVRDVFLFCCYTGLAFSDVKQLTSSHITVDVNGMKWIRKSRQKTKNMCNIPLLDVPLRIIDKYKDHPQCRTKGVLLPVLCNQKMNAYLKELGDICGIDKAITTHVARHTFATFTLANGASIENVAKMLGHSDTKMTRHYAKVLDSSILRDMQNIQQKMNEAI